MPIRSIAEGGMKVLATGRLPGPAWEELDDVEVVDGPVADALDAPRPGVRALIVVDEPVGDAELDLLPDLELVAKYGVGYDNVDVEACARRDIAVVLTRGPLEAATADLALALLLAARRRIVEADRFLREGRWLREPSDILMGEDTTGLTLGIVGLGRIGAAVARRARGFEMRLLYTQRQRRPPELERELGAEFRPLGAMLPELDALTLHCPLTPQTRVLIDRRRLALLPDGACVVNTARGPILDEEALAEEVGSGRLSAGLDVFAHEPEVPEALRRAPNAVLVPHVGSLTTGTRAAMTRMVVDNVLALTAGQPLLTPLV